MHLDSNSDAIDSMNRASAPNGWIHHLTQNFAYNSTAPTGIHNPLKFESSPPSSIGAGASLKFEHSPPLADHHTLHHHQQQSALHNGSLQNLPQQQQQHFTELRTAAENCSPWLSQTQHYLSAAAVGAAPPSAPLSPSSLHQRSSGNAFAQAGHNGWSSRASTAPGYPSPHFGMSPHSAEQFAAVAAAGAYSRSTGCNLMSTGANGGSSDGSAAAAAAAMHMPAAYFMSAAAAAHHHASTSPGGCMPGGGGPGNPFSAVAAAVGYHPAEMYACAAAAAHSAPDHTSSTFRYNPNTGKTRTKDKYRVVYTDRQRAELENEFRSAQYITIRRKSELAMQVGLSERQVKIWFQNRRAKERKVSRKPGSGGGGSGRGGGGVCSDQDSDAHSMHSGGEPDHLLEPDDELEDEDEEEADIPRQLGGPATGAIMSNGDAVEGGEEDCLGKGMLKSTENAHRTPSDTRQQHPATLPHRTATALHQLHQQHLFQPNLV